MAASNETLEDNNEINIHQKLDIYNELENKIKARNKIMCRKEIVLPCALVEDMEQSDILDSLERTPQLKPHKHLEDNERFVGGMIESIRNLKRTSELEMDFVINEGTNQDDEVNQSISRLRQQSDKLFKRIINTQVSFNECLTNNLVNESENKSHIQNLTKLIEETCKFDRGIEAIIRYDKNKLEESVEKKLEIEGINEFNNKYNELAQGVLSTIYETGVKKSKTHEHLLSIKQYNKYTKEVVVEKMETTGRLDPFTQQPITNPVTNKVCNHVYDHDSVDQMFQRKLFICCPYIGCTNKRFTKKDILFDLNTSINNE